MLNFRYELYAVGDQLQSSGKSTSVSDLLVRELTEGVSTSINTIQYTIPAVLFRLNPSCNRNISAYSDAFLGGVVCLSVTHMHPA